MQNVRVDGVRMPRSHTLDARVTQRRSRWLRLNRVLSAGVGAVAVTTGVVLGVTAPSTSPVQSAPAATAATAAPADPATTGGVTDGGTAVVPADRGRGGDGRFRMAGFDRRRR
jgi:predicted component of type VI protein secretion system